jgi:hypothetical protein
MIRDDLRMHRAGVFLFALGLIVLVVAVRVIEVNRVYLCAGAYRECKCAD